MRQPNNSWRCPQFWGKITNVVLLEGGIENENLKITTLNGTIGVLRLYNSKSLDQVEAEIATIERLPPIINCPKPIAGSDGNKVFLWERRPVVLWNFIEGNHVPRDQLSSPHIEKLAVQLAALHSATSRICTRTYWDISETISVAKDLAERLKGRPYCQLAKMILREIYCAQKLLFKLDNSFLCMLHGDIDQNNLIFDPQGLCWLIDWDDASYGPVILDYAIAFRNLILKRLWETEEDPRLLRWDATATLLEFCADRESLSRFGDWVRFACARFFLLMLHTSLKTGAYPSKNDKNFAILALAIRLQKDLNLLGIRASEKEPFRQAA